MSLTTDPNDADIRRGPDPGPVPQNKKYLVLSDEEKSKGFVRPVRTSYVHVGAPVCGKLDSQVHENPEMCYVCAMNPDTEHDRHHFAISHPIKKADLDKVQKSQRLPGGCGTLTTMHQSIAETYARDPNFYGYTYCCACSKHLPIDEFVWSGTNESVGS